jgi:hypothetical protein
MRRTALQSRLLGFQQDRFTTSAGIMNPLLFILRQSTHCSRSARSFISHQEGQYTRYFAHTKPQSNEFQVTQQTDHPRPFKIAPVSQYHKLIPEGDFASKCRRKTGAVEFCSYPQDVCFALVGPGSQARTPHETEPRQGSSSYQ